MLLLVARPACPQRVARPMPSSVSASVRRTLTRARGRAIAVVARQGRRASGRASRRAGPGSATARSDRLKDCPLLSAGADGGTGGRCCRP
eukprot:scaffold59939_cov33-Phaeocystis_antarctica.AAC.1